IEKPDYLATIDVDESSPTYGRVIHRLETGLGDELHHMGWNAFSSCHGMANAAERKYLIVPGVRTTNFNIIDCSTDPRRPSLAKVIDGDEVKEKTNLSAPHTIHCLHEDIIVSMLGDADGNGPGGFLHLDQDFNVLGRWENDLGAMQYNYDFWYQPRHNMMISTEWASPKTFMPGFDLEDVARGKYGQHIPFWDFENRSFSQSIDLGEEGLIPFEGRFNHNLDSSDGLVGVALASNVFHYWKDGEQIKIEKVIDVLSVDVDTFPVSLPVLITDILISLDDRYLYF